jgi:serine/threonine protein phosphatase 1
MSRNGHANAILFAQRHITMSSISKVKRCVRLARNVRGRDLVVGDLHGHRSLLERELDRLGFDPARDRVLSVGDLVDRGPESIGTLLLIEEPWFHAVLGNHELMLLNYLGYYSSRIHSRKSFPTGGGEWINEAMTKHRRLVARLADRVAALPLSIHVAAAMPFNVMHGDLQPIGAGLSNLFRGETVCVHRADSATSSRSNFGEALKSELLSLRFAQHNVQISNAPVGDLPVTYVGHSPVRHITVHNSYVYIDQGVCTRPTRNADPIPPTVLDHTQFAYWLGGVATARGPARGLGLPLPSEGLLAIA